STVGMSQQEARRARCLPGGPLQDSHEITSQFIVSPDHSAPARARAVAAKIDCNHVDFQGRAEGLGHVVVCPAMFTETVRDDHGSARFVAMPPPAPEHDPVRGADLDLANRAPRSCHPLPLAHLALAPGGTRFSRRRGPDPRRTLPGVRIPSATDLGGASPCPRHPRSSSVSTITAAPQAKLPAGSDAPNASPPRQIALQALRTSAMALRASARQALMSSRGFSGFSSYSIARQ